MARRPRIAPAHELAVDPSLEDVRRFFDKITEVKEIGPGNVEKIHWLWQGRTDCNGYGRFDYGGTEVGAHRFAYALLKGVVPKLRQVHHNGCRYHSCVHPRCLKPLTLRGNSRAAAATRITEPSLPFNSGHNRARAG